MKKLYGTFLLMSLALSGCASWYDTQVAQPAEYHQPLQVDENYNISGRFSIVTPQKDYYGNFNWQRESGDDHLAFMSPLGNTVAQIVVESGIATLNNGSQVYSGHNLDQMMQEQLGFSLPVNYLHYWLQGVPLPQYQVQNRLNSGFGQLNWKIEYLSWQDRNHPKIVQVSNDNLRIKLIIEWPEAEELDKTN